MRRLLMLAFAAPFLLVLLVACGGGGDDDPSEGDRSYVTQASSSLKQVSGRFAAIVECADDEACITGAGQPLADAADQEIALVESQASSIDDACLRDSSGQVLRYLRTMKALGSMAADGDMDGVAQAIDQATVLDRQVLDGITKCVPGAEDNAQLNAANALQDAFADVRASGQRLASCEDFSCASDEGLSLQQASEAGAAKLDELRTGGGLSTCASNVLDLASQALSAYAEAGAAIQENDEAAATQAFTKGQGLEAQALREGC